MEGKETKADKSCAENQREDSAWEFFIAQEERSEKLNTDTSQEDESSTNQKQNSGRIEWIKKFFLETKATDWAIAFLTAGLLVVGYWQWKAISGQLGEMKSSGNQTDQLIKLYYKQTETLGRSADIADKNEKYFEYSMRMQLRSYVYPRFMNLAEPIVPNKITKIANGYENGGNTPAFNVSSLATTESIVDGSNPKFIFKALTGSKASIAPRGTFDEQVFIGPQTPTQIAQIRTGKRKIYVVGRITYSDVFNTAHHTEYCMMLVPETGEFVGCPYQGKSD